MIKKRTGEPWKPADEFGRSLPSGIGVNLLVPEVSPMADFCNSVLGASIIYADEDFAALEIEGSVFMLHADHTYADHEMSGLVSGAEYRGTGLEIRLYGVDPDIIEARARQFDHHVLSATTDKPHGLRECHIIAPHGYVFVPTGQIK